MKKIELYRLKGLYREDFVVEGYRCLLYTSTITEGYVVEKRIVNETEADTADKEMCIRDSLWTVRPMTCRMTERILIILRR